MQGTRERRSDRPRWRATIAAVLLATSVAHAQGSADPPTTELSFSSFFTQPVGPRGLEISRSLMAANEQQVRLVGHIVVQERPVAGRFLLTARPLRMSEHADGEADDLPPATVTVVLDESQRDRVVAHRTGPVTLVGRLQVGREAQTSGRISWVRLYLAPDALAEAHAELSSAPALHTH